MTQVVGTRWSKRSTILGHLDSISGIRYSPCGTWLATCGIDATIRIHEARSGNLITILHHSSPVTHIDWCPTGEWLATTGTDATLLVWGVRKGAPAKNGSIPVSFHKRFYATYTSPILCCGFSSDGAYLWFGTGQGDLVILGTPGHETPVSSSKSMSSASASSPAASRALFFEVGILSDFGTMAIVHANLASGNRWLAVVSGNLHSVPEPGPAGALVAPTASSDVFVYDMFDPDSDIHRLSFGHILVSCVQFNHQGNILALACSDGSLSLWIFRAAAWVRIVQLIVPTSSNPDVSASTYSGTLTSLCWSADDTLLVAGSSSGGAWVWSIEAGQVLNYVEPSHQDPLSWIPINAPIAHVNYHPRHNVVSLALANQPMVEIWSVAAGIATTVNDYLNEQLRNREKSMARALNLQQEQRVIMSGSLRHVVDHMSGSPTSSIGNSGTGGRRPSFNAFDETLLRRFGTPPTPGSELPFSDPPAPLIYADQPLGPSIGQYGSVAPPNPSSFTADAPLSSRQILPITRISASTPVESGSPAPDLGPEHGPDGNAPAPVRIRLSVGQPFDPDPPGPVADHAAHGLPDTAGPPGCLSPAATDPQDPAAAPSGTGAGEDGPVGSPSSGSIFNDPGNDITISLSTEGTDNLDIRVSKRTAATCSPVVASSAAATASASSSPPATGAGAAGMDFMRSARRLASTMTNQLGAAVVQEFPHPCLSGRRAELARLAQSAQVDAQCLVETLTHLEAVFDKQATTAARERDIARKISQLQEEARLLARQQRETRKLVANLRSEVHTVERRLARTQKRHVTLRATVNGPTESILGIAHASSSSSTPSSTAEEAGGGPSKGSAGQMGLAPAGMAALAVDDMLVWLEDCGLERPLDIHQQLIRGGLIDGSDLLALSLEELTRAPYHLSVSDATTILFFALMAECRLAFPHGRVIAMPVGPPAMAATTASTAGTGDVSASPDLGQLHSALSAGPLGDSAPATPVSGAAHGPGRAPGGPGSLMLVWTSREVAAWLESVGLAPLTGRFQSSRINGVSMLALSALTDQSLSYDIRVRLPYERFCSVAGSSKHFRPFCLAVRELVNMQVDQGGAPRWLSLWTPSRSVAEQRPLVLESLLDATPQGRGTAEDYVAAATFLVDAAVVAFSPLARSPSGVGKRSAMGSTGSASALGISESSVPAASVVAPLASQPPPQPQPVNVGAHGEEAFALNLSEEVLPAPILPLDEYRRQHEESPVPAPLQTLYNTSEEGQFSVDLSMMATPGSAPVPVPMPVPMPVPVPVPASLPAMGPIPVPAPIPAPLSVAHFSCPNTPVGQPLPSPLVAGPAGGLPASLPPPLVLSPYIQGTNPTLPPGPGSMVPSGGAPLPPALAPSADAALPPPLPVAGGTLPRQPTPLTVNSALADAVAAPGLASPLPPRPLSLVNVVVPVSPVAGPKSPLSPAPPPPPLLDDNDSGDAHLLDTTVSASDMGPISTATAGADEASQAESPLSAMLLHDSPDLLAQRLETLEQLLSDYLAADAALLAAAPPNMPMIDSSLRCPLSGVIFREPILAPDGMIYEFLALEGWMLRTQRPISPLTKQPMLLDACTPAYLQARLAAAWRFQAQDQTMSVAATTPAHDSTGSDLDQAPADRSSVPDFPEDDSLLAAYASGAGESDDDVDSDATETGRPAGSLDTDVEDDDPDTEETIDPVATMVAPADDEPLTPLDGSPADVSASDMS